jgi:hypothetical protein
MPDYLERLRELLPHGPICLILDQYRTGDTAAFQAKAEHLGISLLWIPKETAGIYQPLDRRVFGALKSGGRAKWWSYCFEHNSP